MTEKLPTLLLPYQVAWIKDQGSVRVAEKSRRIGLSWASACEVTLEAAVKMPYGCDAWYIGYNKDMAIEYIRDVAFWARIFQLEVGDLEESVLEDDNGVLSFAVKFASGYRVTALSSRPSNLRGKRGHIVIDEAAFHDDLDGLIKAAIAVKMWGGKGRVDIISTHNGVGSAFDKIVTEVREGKRPYSLHRCTLDDALEQGLFKRICLVNKAPWSKQAEHEWREALLSEYADHAEEELFCVPARSGGVYLARDLIERQMVDAPVITLAIERGTVVTEGEEQRATVNAWCETNLLPVLVRLDPERMHVTGEDFGRTSDRTVVTVGAIQPNLSVHPAFALEMCNAPFATQRQIVEYVIRHLPHFVHGAFDATGNGAELAEAMSAKFGERVIEQVKINEPWYAEQLPRFKAALEADRFRLIRSADHLVDLSMFRVINGMPKLPSVRKASSDKKLPHRHGDAAISYVMAFYASCLPINSYDGYESPRTRSVQQQSRFTLHAPEEFDAAFTRYGIL